ncbi:MAG: Glyoxalase family protein [Leptospirillum sp. Group II 'C75']|jgi:catechol 2,3-dioxygenase-like lactoylglutathione lyase family enzyme|uniref:ArsI/CadI family heavy metal resistance metalloenzyme n=1 Tax=Leptospirillum sp. Group II 'CF-1' TaxID=1660083 RepID=UPI0000F0CC2D|nr:ArsI/CadI family heavy metal resistance metalloenzyme [Leptospirillum sp. Group II 'CF-1']AKS24189.1 glyoxalase [Leptospirillum sp. Group II 'CF-1']EAY56515.1 MAG: Glyoxalase family protein [Leptospirillum rubarum]EIJ75682.1 MAG: Glyoxalase family protein [Leptospirillum sp. Group II 'C75']
MKRFHLHLSVEDLEQNVRFYSGIFGQPPTVRKDDYAKWMIDDPRINFALSRRGRKTGLDHLGIQAEDKQELEDLQNRFHSAGMPVLEQRETACCYSRSDKHWTVDPQGLAWEAYQTLEGIPVFGEAESTSGDSACCVPSISLIRPT